MTCGIYLLYFKEIPQVYVGQSLNIERRYVDHLRELKNGTHTKKLQSAFYNFGNPDLEIIELCSKQELDARELYHIDLWDAVNDGFNYMSNNSGGGVCVGEQNTLSLYKDTEIINLITFIVENPSMSLIDVSKTMNMSYATVKNVANLSSYTWLDSIIPETYAKLKLLKNTRSNEGERQGSAKFTNEEVERVFFTILSSPITITFEEIAQSSNISLNVVKGLVSSNLSQYGWIKRKYPEEHKKLVESLKTRREYSRSAAARGINYPSIISPIDGSEHTITNVSKFAKDNGLDPGSLNKLLNGKLNSTKGWVRK